MIEIRRNIKNSGIVIATIVLLALSAFAVMQAAPSSNKIILTFDDGHQYRNGDQSVEIMTEFGYVGVVMLPIQVLDWQPASFYIALQDSGWEIAGHSWTHPDLTTLIPSELHHEIVEANAQLESLMGKEIVSFGYPHSRGSNNAEILAKLSEAGFIYGREHMDHSGWDGSPSLQINSFAVKQDMWQERLDGAIGDAQANGISVVMFHGVSEGLNGWGAVTPSMFRSCLQQIEDAGLQVVTFKDLENEPTPPDVEPATTNITLEPFGFTLKYQKGTVTLPLQIIIWGKSWAFKQWSDGNTNPTRNLTENTYTAVYE